MFGLGLPALALAGTGRTARRQPGVRPWRTWPGHRPHILAMASCYIPPAGPACPVASRLAARPGNNFVTYASRAGSLTCDGSRAVGCFWSQALGWPLIWDQDEETAIRAPDGARQFITWGPPLAPKQGGNRLHLDVALPPDGDQEAEAERLLSLGAKRIGIGQGEVPWLMMADPDDNEFRVLTSR